MFENCYKSLLWARDFPEMAHKKGEFSCSCKAFHCVWIHIKTNYIGFWTTDILPRMFQMDSVYILILLYRFFKMHWKSDVIGPAVLIGTWTCSGFPKWTRWFCKHLLAPLGFSCQNVNATKKVVMNVFVLVLNNKAEELKRLQVENPYKI